MNIPAIGIGGIIAIVVLVIVIVLAVMHQIPPITALLLGGLAVARLV